FRALHLFADLRADRPVGGTGQRQGRPRIRGPRGVRCPGGGGVTAMNASSTHLGARDPMEGWVEIGTLAAIPRRGARCIAIPAGRIAVFRTQDDRVYALENR